MIPSRLRKDAGRHESHPYDPTKTVMDDEPGDVEVRETDIPDRH